MKLYSISHLNEKRQLSSSRVIETTMRKALKKFEKENKGVEVRAISEQGVMKTEEVFVMHS